MLMEMRWLVQAAARRQRPLLIGTGSVSDSEWIAEQLTRWCARTPLVLYPAALLLQTLGLRSRRTLSGKSFNCM
jgi:hypothetical protein